MGLGVGVAAFIGWLGWAAAGGRDMAAASTTAGAEAGRQRATRKLGQIWRRTLGVRTRTKRELWREV